MIYEFIELKNLASKEKYGKKLRRVAVWDEQNKQTIELIYQSNVMDSQHN